jgi:hypothetical protein
VEGQGLEKCLLKASERGVDRGNRGSEGSPLVASNKDATKREQLGIQTWKYPVSPKKESISSFVWELVFPG